MAKTDWRSVKERKKQQRRMRKQQAAKEWDMKMRLRMDRHSANILVPGQRRYG